MTAGSSLVSKDEDFEIVDELRTWRGNSIPLEGQSLQTVLDGLQRRKIDVQITLTAIEGLAPVRPDSSD